MKGKGKKTYLWIFISVLFYAALIGLWYLVYVIGVEKMNLWKPYAFPSPSGVWDTLKRLIESRELLEAVISSLLLGLTGYIAAILIGGIFGLVFVFVPVISKLLCPIFMGIQTLPSVCWVPFAILWFGLEKEAVLFVVVMGAAFGIALSVQNSIANIPPIYVKAAKTMGARGTALFFKVVLPAAMPQLVSGLRQGWSFAWRALMSGEVMTASAGLGYTLMMGRSMADINQVTLVILVIILVGVVIDKCFFNFIENRVKYQ